MIELPVSSNHAKLISMPKHTCVLLIEVAGYSTCRTVDARNRAGLVLTDFITLAAR
jgi:hypothetical protein